MAITVNLHNTYMGLTFRPLIRPDGTVGRVGVSNLGPACVDPEVYPNLLTAAPALYQAISIIKEQLNPVTDSQLIESLEAILVFAQTGYLGGVELDSIMKGLMQ